MRFLRLNNRRRHLLTCSLLAVVLLRAYVPAGFMPQSGNPLQLKVCPAGMPSHTMPSHTMPQHGAMAMDAAPGTHSSGGAAHVTDWCLGFSPTAGPIADGPVLASVQAVLSQPLPAFGTRPAGMRSLRAHRARAPPPFA